MLLKYFIGNTNSTIASYTAEETEARAMKSSELRSTSVVRRQAEPHVLRAQTQGITPSLTFSAPREREREWGHEKFCWLIALKDHMELSLSYSCSLQCKMTWVCVCPHPSNRFACASRLFP